MSLKKQIMLSVTGLVIMLVLLLGASFAFFSYSHVEEQNNSIHTGQIVFDFEDIKEIKMNNQFPISYEEAKNEKEGNPDNNSMIMKFKVSGYNTLNNGMNYRLLITKGDDDSTDLLDDSIVYAQIVAPTVTPGYSVNDFGYNEDKSFGQTGTGAPLTGLNSGKELKLLDGNIHTAAESASQEFIIIVWIDSSKVVISDTMNRDKNNRAIAIDDPVNGLVGAKENDIGKLVYRTSEYSKKSISIKIKAINF